MSRWGTRIAAAALAAALLVCLLVSCGGSDSSGGSTGGSSTATAPGSSTDGGSSGDEQKQPEQGSDGGESGSADTAPLEISGGGSGQFRVKGGDNSVQEFGEEGSETELEEAAIALHDFLVARAEENWRTACARLSQAVAKQLEQLMSRAKQAGSGKCPQALAALTPKLPRTVQRETTIVDAGSLRHEDERAFLIYRGGEGTVYAIPMTEEDDWKVGALAPVPLS